MKYPKCVPCTYYAAAAAAAAAQAESAREIGLKFEVRLEANS
jgi:hypothetical protein